MAYDAGSPVPLTFEVRDSNGNLANATTAVLTVLLPDGTTVTPALSNPTVGNYQIDYQPPVPGPGPYQWHFTTTGLNSAATSGSFDVRDMFPPYMVSLADVKAHLNLTDNVDDDELRPHIEAATRVIENVVGPVVVRSFSETKPPARVLVLNKTPAVALTAVTPVRNNGVPYDITTLDLDPTTGVVRRLDGGWIGIYGGFGGVSSYYGSDYAGDALRVTYTAGRRQVPANMTLAAKLIIADMWETQRGHATGRRPGLGRDPEEAILPEPGLSLKIRRVLEMLEPDRRAALMA